jgi:type VI secretion system protein ImpG
MTDELLPYYNQELAYFRQVAPEFARRHETLAGRLRMSDTEIDDPHVERLIQAVAFLNARTRRKLDDEFPEISQAILQVLYPQYLRPFPSATVVRFALPADQAELVQGFAIPRGASLATDVIDGEPYRFRTCYPVSVWPLQVTEASVHRGNTPVPGTGWRADVRAHIRLEIATLGRKSPIEAVEFNELRLFIHAPAAEAYQLYEAILNDTVGVVASSDAAGEVSIPLAPGAIRPVGFERDEALVEALPRSFPGYGLLTEYFAFPQKFLFFDLVGLDRTMRARLATGSSMTIDICCRRELPALERSVTAQTFQLGCCPVINLFSQRAEPIRLTQHQSEYPVVPDARRPLAYEVHSIDEVVAVSPTNEVRRYTPFYSLTHHDERHGQGARFWHASRRSEATGSADRTDMFLSLVDADFSPTDDAQWTVDIMTTCLNPQQLPFGGGRPRFQLETGGPLDAITCLVPPTKTLRPSRPSSLLWRLVSHLTLNHLSLVSADASADPLREILKLYDMTDSKETQNLIAGLLSVRASASVGRPSGRGGSVCRGLDVTLHFDEDRFTGNGLYLFGAILERFLGLYCAINTFTRTTVTTNRREDKVREWPARAGELVFL